MNNNIAFYKQEVKKILIERGWIIVFENPKKNLIAIYNDTFKCHANIMVNSKTVITSMRHPKEGYTILERKGVGLSDMKSIMDNPRYHSDRGRRIDKKK